MKVPTVKPVLAEAGDLWLEEWSGTLWVYANFQWNKVGAGEVGAVGPQGVAGPPGPPGAARVIVVRETDGSVRLGDHEAVRIGSGSGQEVWTCAVCGGSSADAGVLAETECSG